APRPVLVGPADAEREVRPLRLEHVLKRPLEQPLPVEPIVVVAEARETVTSRELGLRLPHFGEPQVVEPEVRGKPRLEGAGEERLRARHVRPLPETLPPPRVVLGYRMELREVEGDGADALLTREHVAPPIEEERAVRRDLSFLGGGIRGGEAQVMHDRRARNEDHLAAALPDAKGEIAVLE